MLKESLQKRIANIRQKIDRAGHEAHSCFGSNVHRFALNPPLAEATIAEFENQSGVRLPEDYRAFLTQLGNGGAGPYYGLAPLADWFDISLEAPAPAREILTAPFPLTYDTSIQPGASRSADYAAWQHGSIYLCDQGCSYCARLVVSGEARGRVVNLDQSGASAPYFVQDAGFLDWYERWLDAVLADDVPLWFGFDNPAYEPEATAALAAVHPDWPPIPTGVLKSQLERIRGKLSGAWDLTTHSAYQPPLPEEQLAAFEEAYQVQLPTDYRAFLQYIQGGGVGPYYGLTPFKYAAPDESEAQLLSQPFPITIEGALQPHARSIKLQPDHIFAPGMLYVCHQGRGYYAWLVVSGEARGRVLYVNTDGPFLPYFTRDTNFLDWYERWLDTALAGSMPHWFGYDNPAYDINTFQDSDDLHQITWQAHL